MKKLINRPDNVVAEMLDGLVAVHPGLARLAGYNVIIRGELPEPADRPVAVVCGGGSGHEPAWAGYVGRGLLAAAVAGDVFTSPSPDAVLAAIRAVTGPRGVLLVIKNYTGDRLNFGLAAERARAEGIAVETALVADDVALAASVENAGRRGLAGTVFVNKIAGAAAESGAALAQVAAEARTAARDVRTMGVALTPCIVPAAGRPGFSLAEGEIELGLGVHGEPGVRRAALEPADVLVDQLLNAILGDFPTLPGRVALLVNNLGATPTMELAIVARRAVAVLEGKGIRLDRAYVGTFLSSLEMAGVSLSLLPLDEDRLARLDAATEAPAWPNAAARPRLRRAPAAPPPSETKAPLAGPQTELGRRLQTALESAARALITSSDRLTQLDQAAGDGDLGISLERGARAIQESLPAYPLDDPAATLDALGVTLQRVLGGTSGPLYAAFLVRAAATLKRGRADDPASWAAAFRAGCNALAELGGAARGDRTMLDALLPAADAFAGAVASGVGPVEALRGAARAAAEGAKATASMKPRRGRSSYLGDRVLGLPDPGAEAVAVWLAAVAPG
jgi:dihydroxyacetone kinase